MRKNISLRVLHARFVPWYSGVTGMNVPSIFLYYNCDTEFETSMTTRLQAIALTAGIRRTGVLCLWSGLESGYSLQAHAPVNSGKDDRFMT